MLFTIWVMTFLSPEMKTLNVCWSFSLLISFTLANLLPWLLKKKINLYILKIYFDNITYKCIVYNLYAFIFFLILKVICYRNNPILNTVCTLYRICNCTEWARIQSFKKKKIKIIIYNLQNNIYSFKFFFKITVNWFTLMPLNFKQWLGNYY